MEKLTYEEAFIKLEKTVEELDSGELSLEESIEKYEEGLALYKFCEDFLKSAEGRIEILTKKGDKILETDFNSLDVDYE